MEYIPEILAWLFGIVLAVRMVRRGGTKAEKLLLAGCSLMFIYLLASASHILWYIIGMAWVFMSILILAGLVCLVWAFWVRFWRRRVST